MKYTNVFAIIGLLILGRKENVEMKSKLWGWVLILGVLCFPIGAVLMIFGTLQPPTLYVLPVLGMILIGAGTSGRRRTS